MTKIWHFQTNYPSFKLVVSTYIHGVRRGVPETKIEFVLCLLCSKSIFGSVGNTSCPWSDATSAAHLVNMFLLNGTLFASKVKPHFVPR